MVGKEVGLGVGLVQESDREHDADAADLKRNLAEEGQEDQDPEFPEHDRNLVDGFTRRCGASGKGGVKQWCRQLRSRVRARVVAPTMTGSQGDMGKVMSAAQTRKCHYCYQKKKKRPCVQC